MSRLLDGRTRVYATGRYVDVDIVEKGEWVGVSSLSLHTFADSVRSQIRQATTMSENVLGEGKARVDIEPTLEGYAHADQ